MNERIQALLYSVGITGNYVGFYQAASAIESAMDNPELLLMVTSGLYLDVARQYKTEWKTVERNIRTVISVAWRRARHELEAIAGYPLSRKPTPAQFIAIMCGYLQASDTIRT